MQDQAWDVASSEEASGARLSFHCWPSSRLEATRMVVPLGCLYTPLKQITHMPPALEYDPIRCKGCAAVLNPYCRIDYQAKVWFCPFCARAKNLLSDKGVEFVEHDVMMNGSLRADPAPFTPCPRMRTNSSGLRGMAGPTPWEISP